MAPLLEAVGVAAAAGAGVVTVVVFTVVVVVVGAGTVGWVMALTGVAGRTVVVVTVVTMVVAAGFTMVCVTVVTVVVGVGWVTTVVVDGAVTRNGCAAAAFPCDVEPEPEVSGTARSDSVLSVAGAESGPSLAVGSMV
jgi:hypothetical protein